LKRQAEIFLESEAKAWFARNQNKLAAVKHDPVIEAIESAKLTPMNVLEVGCSNGWRVRLMRERWKCKAHGIDPMFNTNLWDCQKGTADNLVIYGNEAFDLVIYGWCLYLCDREDLFMIANEGDRVLKDGGYICIHDFHSDRPHKNKYKHYVGLFSYKMDYSRLWLSNPSYSLHTRTMFNSGDEQTSITIIRKSMNDGWPLRA
jgi:ubiquinone/menaquinone biosynthesis C-methylase UbiE